ncbi:MAG: hypothetical protein AAB794_00035 [Patescibacteria group bacterium]
MTTIAVIGHPQNGAELTDTQRAGLASTLRQLDLLTRKKKMVAVLSSPVENAMAYANRFVTHFGLKKVEDCEGLLRDTANGDFSDGCDCLDDYLNSNFGLVVVVVATSIALDFACALAKYPAAVGTTVYTYPNPSGV